MIPKGIYQLGESGLKGPCKNPPELRVERTLQAFSTDTEGDGLLVMEYVDRWEKNDCHLKKICKKLPIVNARTNLITKELII